MTIILLLCLLVISNVNCGENDLTGPKPTKFKNGTEAVDTSIKRPTLDDLLKAFHIQELPAATIGNRFKRAPCEIPAEWLTHMAKTFRNVAGYIPQPNDTALQVKEPLKETLSAQASPCARAKFALWSDVDKLTTFYLIMLLNGPSFDETEYQRLKNLCDEVNKTFEDDFQVINKIVNDDTKKRLEEVMDEKTSLSLQLERLTSALNYNITIQKRLKENMLQLVISDVDRGSFDTAKTTFLELGAADIIFKVIEKMDKPNVENVLKFVKELPWFMHRIYGMQALLKKGNLDLNVFWVEYEFKELMALGNEPRVVAEIQHHIDDLQKRLDQQLAEMVQNVAEKIATKQPNNYNSVIQFSKNHEKAFNAHLEEFVEKVYDNTDNDYDVIEKLLVFSDALTIISQSARVYIKLYKLMESNRDISFESSLRIAFKIQELMQMKNHINTPKDVKAEMDELKEKTPNSVKSIIWGSVCLKNEEINAYLISKDKYDNHRTTIGLSPTAANLWRFESDDNANSFKIRNTENKELLYAESEIFAYSTYKRRIFGWRKDDKMVSNHLWKLDDIKWRDGKFLIKNNGRNEYLNAERIANPPTIDSEIQSCLAKITSKSGELPNAIKRLVDNYTKMENLQPFTWRRRSRGNNPEWLIIDSSQCPDKD